MTIQELYDWAKENRIENLQIVKEYEDHGGTYGGTGYEIDKHTLNTASYIRYDNHRAGITWIDNKTEKEIYSAKYIKSMKFVSDPMKAKYLVI